MGPGQPRPASVSAALALLLRQVAGAGADISYGVVFDAGSSGSRIHVYTWRGGGPAPFELVEDRLVKRKPGLSSFAARPEAAGSSLDELLAVAEETVPPERRASTPVFLMASAGLRLLAEEARGRILESVRDRLAVTPFLFRREWAHVISGRDESLFGWVTVNYLLGTLASAGGGADRAGAGPTRATVDLGGGSVQLAFAVPSGVAVPEDHLCELSLGGRQHRLYCRSHLGFGLNEARRSAASALRLGQEGVGVLEHPCLPVGHRLAYETLDSTQQEFVGLGSYDRCAALYSGLLDGQQCHEPASCALGAAGQPSVRGGVLGFSYLYDRTRAIGLLDGDVQELGSQNMTLAAVQAAARGLCALVPSEVEARFAVGDDSSKWPDFCGDVAYILVLLEKGFGIGVDVPLTMGNQLGETELVWTLGAMIVKSSELASQAGKDEL